MIIYIASFFETRERLLPIAEELKKQGHQITSSWLYETKKPDELSRYEWWNSLAKKDLFEIDGSDLVILDTIDVNPRGGREVECGYALACGKNLYIVGPLRNVFHTQCNRQFMTWENCLKHTDPFNTYDVKYDLELSDRIIADPVEDAKKEQNASQEHTQKELAKIRF